MNFTLLPYQEKDVDIMTTKKRLINANEPGLGKTLETLEAVRRLGSDRIFVVCPKIAAGVWRDEALKWFGWESIIMTGTPTQRRAQREQFVRSDCKLLITNYAQLKEIVEVFPTWDTIIADEAHLGGLLNHKTQKFKLMKKLKSNHLFLLTGTPMRKGPQDFWSMLHLLDPTRFRSYWSFVHRNCIVINNGFGKEILGKPKDPLKFNTMLKHYMIRNLKKDVLKELPPKRRQMIKVQMTKKQRKKYEELYQEMMTLLDTDEVLLTPNIMTRDLRLRQLLVCPRMLDIHEDGAALDALVEELIPEEFSIGRAVVVATPFRKAIPFIRERLEEAFPDAFIEEIHGQIKEHPSTVAQRFELHSGPKILLYTIKSGASWTAVSASTGFMLGYEWSVEDNTQAEDRLHRKGQLNRVHWKYILHENTVDEAVASKLDEKQNAQNWTFRPQEIYKQMYRKHGKFD